MKTSFRLLCLASLPLLANSASATSLTGAGYIDLTEPSTWTPTSDVYDNARFIWYPDKAAFRFGDLDYAHRAYWNAANIGESSFAGGFGTLASGSASFAFGEFATATDTRAVAMGYYANASGEDSFALGTDSVASGLAAMAFGSGAQATGDGSLALGAGYASDMLSVAIGSSAMATGPYSLAITTIDSALADGEMSISIGNSSSSTGLSSLALGSGVSALADYSTAIGTGAYTDSYNSVALGAATISKRMNGVAVTPGTPQTDDPVFMVSQGPDDPWGTPPTRNAITVYRNGVSHFNGLVRVKPGGDIPMGSFTTKPSGVSYP